MLSASRLVMLNWKRPSLKSSPIRPSYENPQMRVFFRIEKSSAPAFLPYVAKLCFSLVIARMNERVIQLTHWLPKQELTVQWYSKIVNRCMRGDAPLRLSLLVHPILCLTNSGHCGQSSLSSCCCATNASIFSLRWHFSCGCIVNSSIKSGKEDLWYVWVCTNFYIFTPFGGYLYFGEIV